MARSIGEIEVTLSLDTGGLIAQAKREGKTVGRVLGESIEEEIDRIEVGLAPIDGKKEAQLLKKQIELALRNIVAKVDVDFEKGALEKNTAELKKWREREEAIDLMMDVALDKTDVKEMQAQLEKMSKTQRQIIFDTELHDDEVRAALEQMERDKHRIEFQINLDDARATAELERLQKERIFTDWNLKLDVIQAEQDIAAFEARAEREHLDWVMEIDFTEANAGLRAFQAKHLGTRIEMEVLADTKKATEEVLLLARLIDANDASLTVEADLARARASLEAFRILQANNDIEIPVDINVQTLDAALSRMEAKMAAGGNDSGISFSEGFHSGFGGGMLSGDNTKLIIAAVAAMGDALSAGLSGLVAEATAILSSLTSAISGAIGAGIPVIFGLAAAATAAGVGFVGFGDAMSVVNDEFKAAKEEGRAVNEKLIASSAAFRELSPNARKAALAFADVRDELAASQKLIQQELFKDFDKQIKDLAKTTLPNVTEALQIAGSTVNDFGLEMAGVAKQTDFKALMMALDPALDDAFDSAVSFTGVLEPFLLAAAPAAQELAEWIERGADHLLEWVQNNPTEITEFLEGGVDSLKMWGELLGSTAGLLSTVFQAGKADGDNFLVSLNNLVEKWDRWLESAKGQTALKDFFDTGKEAVDAFKPVIDGLKEAIEILVTDESMGQFHELGTALGEAIPVIAEIISLFGQLGTINAISNILEVVSPLIELLGDIPPEILATIGQFIVLVSVASKVHSAIETIGTAIGGLTKGNAILLGITAAISVAMIAWDIFGTQVNETEERTKELTTALNDTVDAIILSGDEANSAAVGMRALSEAIFTTGEDGTKLGDAFAEINSGAGDATLGINDTVDVLSSLQGAADGGRAGLKKLAEGYGLTTGQAEELADIIASTDDQINTDNAHGELANRLRDLATETGLSREEMYDLAGALEEVQDQSEKTDIKEIAEQFNRIASTGTEAEQAMLAKAEAMAKDQKETGNSLVIYENYTKLLAESKQAEEDLADGIMTGVSAQEQIQMAIDDAILAHEAEAEALRVSREEAMKAWQEQEKLKDATENAAIAFADSVPGMQGMGAELVEIGNSLRDASAEADALASALDILIGPALGLEEAASNVQANIDDLTASLAENGATLDLNTEQGRANAEMLRTSITGITDYATAQLEAGASNEEVAATAAASREALIQQAESFFTTSEAAGTARQQAEDYINQLGLTPELIATAFQQPGLVDALLNAEDLTLLYDAAGNPVVTEFEAIGLDPSLATSEEFKELLDEISATTATPKIDAETSAAPAKGSVDKVQASSDKLDKTTAKPKIDNKTNATTAKGNVDAVVTSMEELDAFNASPTITMPTIAGIQTKVDALQTSMDTIDAMTATPEITIPSAATEKAAVDALDKSIDDISDGLASVTVSGVQFAIDKVNELHRAITNLPLNRTVTITQRTVNAGAMAGEIIHGPTVRNVGERGYAEAIVPLQLPLNRVDPSVRSLAEVLRGGGSGGSPLAQRPSKTVNNYMTIQPQSADPRAVATQVVNRSVVMANRG